MGKSLKTFYSFGCILLFLIGATINASAQLVINEVESDPPAETDESCQYVELRGTPGATVPAGTYFASIDGDSSVFGQLGFVSNLGGKILGSNGTITLVIAGVTCAGRTFPAGTTVVPVDTVLNLGQSAETFAVFTAPVGTVLIEGDDIDLNDNKVIDPSFSITIIDSIAWAVDPDLQATYGPILVITGTGDVPDAATRFFGNNNTQNANAFYWGEILGPPDSSTAYTSPQSANFPVGGQLTPGAPNVGTQPRNTVVDINGDGRTDFVVVRSTGGAGTQSTWLTSLSGGNPTSQREWGINGDLLVPGDYDGDGKDDVAVFRASNGTFYVIESATLTIRVDQFGQAGDNPRVVGDYNGDGRDDLSLYRAGTQSTWFYKTSPNSLLTAVDWGQTGDSPAPGDYDGDGKADFVVQRADGANGRFWIRSATGAISSELFGLATDDVVPGDYDGDGRTDLATVRTTGGFYVWDFEPSGTAGSTVVSDTWGVPGDLTTQGDYDGDGKTDYSIWRPGTPATFYMMTVGTRLITTKDWGQTGDLPAARYNTF